MIRRQNTVYRTQYTEDRTQNSELRTQIVRNNRLSSIVNQQGSALIVTILLVALLVTLTVNFVYEVYIDSSTLSNWGNAQRASYIAKSGQTLSTEFLYVVSQYYYTDEREIELPVERDFGDNTDLSIRIEDENSKFNINSIIDEQNGTTNEKALSSLKKLFEYLNIDPGLSLRIADWIDPDSEPRLSYSEDMVKNTYLWSMDELKLIEGIDKDTFDKIVPHITIYQNTNSMIPQVNINTASLPVLVSLHSDMTETLAQNIIDYRENYPFEYASDIINVPGMEQIGSSLGGKITVKSTNFRIVSRATVNEITRIIESVMDTSMNIHFWREA